MTKYWINIVSLDHVRKGVEDGFTQANYGKADNLKRLSRGDYIIFYSPRTSYRRGKPLQKFTAIGRIADDEPYQVEMNPSFHPWRRRVEFFPCDEAEIHPLLDELDFISDKQHWGLQFRRGLFEINDIDFERIRKTMGAEIL